MKLINDISKDYSYIDLERARIYFIPFIASTFFAFALNSWLIEYIMLFFAGAILGTAKKLPKIILSALLLNILVIAPTVEYLSGYMPSLWISIALNYFVGISFILGFYLSWVRREAIK